MTSSSALWSIEPSAAEVATRTSFEAWMERALGDATVHARFANTLSMLEHIGSVKIARTQSGPSIDADVLQHLAEEARHADVLKRIVVRITGNQSSAYGDDELLAGAAARAYFARLDAVVRAFVRVAVASDHRHAAAYGLVTWLVERRAMWLYPAYQQRLQNLEAGFSVRSIIGEETRHLEDVVAALARIGLDDAGRVDGIVRREEELFGRLASSMYAVTRGGDSEEVTFPRR